MANFQAAKRAAERLNPRKVSNDLFNFIRTLENEMAQFNRARLFIDSEDVEGNPIGFYSPATEAITEGRKKAGDPFNLFDTGEFLPSIFAKVEQESIFFDAKDPKTPEVLSNLLTTDIFGLNDEDLQRAIDEKILPFFLDYYRNNLVG